MGKVSKKDELIYDYLREAHNSQKELLTQIDARVGNYLIIISLVLGISSYFSLEIINLHAITSFAIFFTVVSLYLIANAFLVIALWRSIRIFYICKFFIPGVNDEVLKNLLNRESEKADEKKLIIDLAKNYLVAYRSNAAISEQRYKVSKSIKLQIRISIFLFIIILAAIFVMKINTAKDKVTNQQTTSKFK